MLRALKFIRGRVTFKLRYGQIYQMKTTIKTLKNPIFRLTSGLSRDGILMIRVPKRVSPERIIPVQYDRNLCISAVKKAIQQTVEHVETEMTSEEVQQDLLKENIAPMEIEKEEDAVQAASAEVIEAMTIGVAEEAGAEVIINHLSKLKN